MNKLKLDYWTSRIGENVVSYYGGVSSKLLGVTQETNGDIYLNLEGRPHTLAMHCSFDTDEERLLHPNLVNKPNETFLQDKTVYVVHYDTGDYTGYFTSAVVGVYLDRDKAEEVLTENRYLSREMGPGEIYITEMVVK